eukprot:g58603.t1
MPKLLLFLSGLAAAVAWVCAGCNVSVSIPAGSSYNLSSSSSGVCPGIATHLLGDSYVSRVRVDAVNRSSFSMYAYANSSLAYYYDVSANDTRGAMCAEMPNDDFRASCVILHCHNALRSKCYLFKQRQHLHAIDDRYDSHYNRPNPECGFHCNRYDSDKNPAGDSDNNDSVQFSIREVNR